MENISETVMLCMITIAAIQFTVIYFLVRQTVNEKEENSTPHKKIVELLKPAHRNSEQLNSECCN